MPMIGWKDFVEKHSKYATLLSSVPARLPKIMFDKKKRKLPSPYGLFKEWAAKELVGEWTAMKVPVGFCLLITDDADIRKIDSVWKIDRKAIETPVSKNTRKIGYKQEDYGALAKAVGYDL